MLLWYCYILFWSHFFCLLMVHVEGFVAPDNTHWHIHALQDSTGCGIGPSQWPVLVQHTYTRDKSSIPLVRLESPVPISEQVQTYALDNIATGIGSCHITLINTFSLCSNCNFF